MALSSLVVGIGNPLQGADAFGPAVVAALRADAAMLPHTELVDAHTDLLGFIDRFAAVDHVVLVDAFLDEGSGDVIVFEEAAFSRWAAESPSSHEISAVMAVGLFRRLYPAATTRISLVGLDVDEVRTGGAVDDDAVAAGVRSVLALLAA